MISEIYRVCYISNKNQFCIANQMTGFFMERNIPPANP